MDRVSFLKLAFEPKGAVCIHFAASAQDCEERVAKRTDHPTIKFGGGRGAVRSMQDDEFFCPFWLCCLVILEEEGCQERIRKDKRHRSLFRFLFRFVQLEVKKNHLLHGISECVCCQSNWAGRLDIAITF